MSFSDILTRSPLMETVLRSAHLIAQTDASVLICGESGTGKELVAHAIHRISPRRNQVMSTVNCAALPESLAESLLFGHRKGAFSGADSNSVGLLEAANGGSVFLDEIGELSLALQAKLLRFLETGEILPLGETRSRRLDVRVLAATHRDLSGMVRNGSFREDLYYRLMVVPVELPALRQRREDVEMLASHFLQQFARQHGLPAASLGKEAKQILNRHGWPGNVRQLRNLCERLSILTAGKELTPLNLPHEFREPAQNAQQAGFSLPEHGLNLEDLERDLLQQALQRTEQNKSRAARLLGISRDALNYRLKKHALV